ncbi:MAG: hypothetical protein H7841_15560 [Magnetospirillum sp. WYHS-4]
MPVLVVVVLSAFGVLALMAGAAKLADRKKDGPAARDARKSARMAEAQAELYAAVSAKTAAETRVQELSADIADLTRTKNALDESIAALLARQREIQSEIAESDRDIDERHREKMAEMDASVAAQKELALTKIMAWTETEKSRLQERFESSYQAEATALRRQLIEKVTAEFDGIRDYFSAFASERKLMAENEIKDFLAEKRSTILSSLE